jgi:flagellar assembly protein FliH
VSQSVHPVVLRNAPLQTGVVRIGRPVMAAARSERSAAGEPVVPMVSAAEAEGYDKGYSEGLRLGQEEGLRQGTEKGLRCGYEDGLQRGLAEAHARTQKQEKAGTDAAHSLQDKLRQLENVLSALHDQSSAVLTAAHDEIVATCFDLVCRVLGPAMLTKQAVQAQLRELLSHAGRGTKLTLHLHPADIHWVGKAWEENHQINCIADAQVTLGGCVLHSTAGMLDARLETILDACKTSLLAARARQSSESAGQVGT